MTTLKIHPAAHMLPALPDSEYEELKADIKARGQREAIIVKDGHVVDGRHRLRACNELGIEPRIKEYAGADLIQEIASRNLFRRNLTPQERADLVVKMVGDKLETEAQARQRSGLKTGNKAPVALKSAQRETRGRTAERIAAIARVSRDTARKALRAHKDDATQKTRRKRRTTKELPFPEIVRRRYGQFLNRFAVTRHREVKLALVTCLLGQYDRKADKLIAPESVRYPDGSTANIKASIFGELVTPNE
jgi:ParB-like chromosome segregation protein Spo0J